MNLIVQNFKHVHRQSGVSLLEVLVALFVLAVGLLGVIALQAETIKLNQQAYGSTQAIFSANDAAEQMRVNYNLYVDSLTPEQRNNPPVPSLDALLSQKTRTAWENMVKDTVPGGSGEIKQVGSDFIITINYTFDVLDNQKDKLSTTAANTESFDYVLYVRL